MKKIMITGMCGFVGQHMLSYLLHQSDVKVLGIDREEEIPSFAKEHANVEYYSMDLNESEKIEEILEYFKPQAIIHLAAFSSVGKSWKNPAGTFRNNTNILLNILEALRVSGLKCRLLSIGSSEEYGIVAKENLPLTENDTLNPWNPYAVSSVSKQYLSEVYTRGYGIDIVMTRSFNHLGPGQSPDFFIPSIARQLIDMETDHNVPFKLMVGDLSVVRDFTDVRDVVKAYWNLLEKGTAGETYNICSGSGRKLKEIVHTLIECTGQEVQIEVDQARLRPIDNPVIIGSNKKIHKELGWLPEIPLEKSLNDTLEFFRNQ